jgi:hypothetical protein
MDLEPVHFHIVSTRIDQETGRKIKDNSRKLFNVEIRQSGRGHIAVVTDDIECIQSDFRILSRSRIFPHRNAEKN